MFNRCISSACFVAKSGESMQGFSAIVDRCSGFDRGGVCCTSGFCFLRITTHERTHSWSIHWTWRRSSSSSLSSTAYDHAPLYASPLNSHTHIRLAPVLGGRVEGVLRELLLHYDSQHRERHTRLARQARRSVDVRLQGRFRSVQGFRRRSLERGLGRRRQQHVMRNRSGNVF